MEDGWSSGSVVELGAKFVSGGNVVIVVVNAVVGGVDDNGAVVVEVVVAAIGLAEAEGIAMLVLMWFGWSALSVFKAMPGKGSSADLSGIPGKGFGISEAEE